MCTSILRYKLDVVSGVSQDRKVRTLVFGAQRLDLNSDASSLVDSDISSTQPATKKTTSFGIAPDCDRKVSTWRVWRDVHRAGPSCIAPLSATSEVCCEGVTHQGLPDDENCCEPRERSPSEKRVEGNDSADLEEQVNQKLVVPCLTVMGACSIMKPARYRLSICSSLVALMVASCDRKANSF